MLPFQSTLPREERPRCCSSSCVYDYFNPRSHERSDPADSCQIHYYQHFNPRSHERSDGAFKQMLVDYYISIHAPTRGATSEQDDKEAHTKGFQSTLPREERLYTSKQQHSITIISIHAPTRGATLVWLYAWNLPSISIHAPTRGATLICRKRQKKDGFQSTLPREERLEQSTDTLDALIISIHAPTRGATI